MKVFLDTNVLASATATRGLCADVLRTVIEFHNLVVSEHLLAELDTVLKEKFAATPEGASDVLWLLRQDTTMADARPFADVPLKDPADVAIVSAALNGNADVLVTGDKEIVELKQVGSLAILTPRQFWDKERSQPEGPGYGSHARRRDTVDILGRRNTSAREETEGIDQDANNH